MTSLELVPNAHAATAASRVRLDEMLPTMRACPAVATRWNCFWHLTRLVPRLAWLVALLPPLPTRSTNSRIPGAVGLLPLVPFRCVRHREDLARVSTWRRSLPRSGLPWFHL